MGILERTERSMESAMCGLQLKDRKRAKELMLVLGLNETVDQLSIASNVCSYGDVLRREDVTSLREN